MAHRASLVVPVHNEADLLSRNTERLTEYLRGQLTEFEIILVENGSVDETNSIALELCDRLPEVRLIELPEPSLAEALKTGVRDAVHDKVVYFPIDLSVNLDFIPESVRLLDEYDLVVGSKRLREGVDNRSFTRRWLSKGYHGLVRLIYRTGLTDTTCVKAYRRGNLLGVLGEVPSSSQVFETELLVEAQRQGLRLIEIPVTVNDDRVSRQPIGVKVKAKLRDLLSIRLDLLAFILGGTLTGSGVILLVGLSLDKVTSGYTGFLNPYSYLLSILLVTSGFQFLVFGLMATLLLQLRRSVESRLSEEKREKKTK
ncbi:MAG: glycosyltransferase family 2 protein [Candidatus Bathyarchaeota archaeon]|nr:glycosyltransferase family 2 protein [Candidatus Bathyarchaeota archaeon]